MEVGTIQYQEFNYRLVNEFKDKIILMNSYSHSLTDFIDGYGTNGVYKYLPHYYIDKSGNITKLLDTDKDTNLTNTHLDTNSIYITLENLGYLIYKNNTYFDVYNNKYTKSTINTTKKKWRNYTIWESYNDIQYISLSELINMLCAIHNIPLEVIDNNLKKDLNNYKGILYRSNIDEIYRDISPAFDVEKLTNYLKNLIK